MPTFPATAADTGTAKPRMDIPQLSSKDQFKMKTTICLKDCLYQKFILKSNCHYNYIKLIFRGDVGHKDSALMRKTGV